MKSRSPTSLQHLTLSEKTRKMKSVLVVTSIFKKSWSLWRKTWLASSLLEQNLEITLGKFLPTNQSSLFKPPITTQPEEIGGKHGQEPQHNPACLQKLLWERWLKGNCTTVAKWSLFLFCQKNNYLCSIMPAKLLDFLFQIVPIFVGNLTQNSIRLSLSNEPLLLIRSYAYNMPSFLLLFHANNTLSIRTRNIIYAHAWS